MGMFSADLYVMEIILVSAPLRQWIAPVSCLAERRKGSGIGEKLNLDWVYSSSDSDGH